MEWEFAVLDALQGIRTVIGDTVMPAASALSNHGELWIALALLLLIMKKTRRTGLVLATALLINYGLCNGIIKPLVARTRPYDINTAITLIAAKPHDFSFPSGHTACSFAAAGALWLCKSKFRGPAICMAFLIAFSRLYLYMHFPTDVLAGIVCGLFCGWLGKLAVDKMDAYRLHKKAISGKEESKSC